MVIKRYGDSLFRTGTAAESQHPFGTVSLSSDGGVAFSFEPGIRFDHEALLAVSRYIKDMSEARIHQQQAGAPTTTSEEARGRVVSQSGTNLFRGIVGADSKPVGSIEDGPVGPVFSPAPGVAFTHEELLQISGDVKRRTELRS
jgi:hypothetical protein